MRKKGVDIKIRMKKLGHKSLPRRMRYDHVDDADQLEAAKKLQRRAGIETVSADVVPFRKAVSA
jgi:integrase